ncbi:hypothetical protein AUL38_00820 [Leucobacter sp. G161]|nr:hypothetical protein AUL38_00820 [Leucobacter sp. G161]
MFGSRRAQLVTDVSGEGIPCLWMRGGTSKGAFFLESDMPQGAQERDDLARRILGSPDPQQIDGIGGGHPLTSKIAIVGPGRKAGVDLEYEFLQVAVDTGDVTRAQTCGNLLAGVVPFAIERGLLQAGAERTTATVHLVNTGDQASVSFASPGGVLDYSGDCVLPGVPGAGNPIEIEVSSGGGALLPSGRQIDDIDGVPVTLVNNGMPVVVVRASEVGIVGDEGPEELEANRAFLGRVEELRIAAGELFGMGDVSRLSVPKMMLISAPQAEGDVTVRALIPHRVHRSVGVLMAAGVAAATRIPGTVASEWGGEGEAVVLEYPAGAFTSRVRTREDAVRGWLGSSIATRTTRKLFEGRVFPGPTGS